MALTPEEKRRLQALRSQHEEIGKTLTDLNSKINPPTEPVEETPGMLEAAAHGGLQGITFGFSDEAEAKARSMINNTSYEEELKKVRARYKAAEEAHPIVSTVGEIAGGFVPALAAAPAASAIGLGRFIKGASLAQKVGLGIAEGAASGALYGAGKAEEDTGEEALSAAKSGAAVGAAIPIIGGAIGKAVKSLKSEHAPEFSHLVSDVFESGRKSIKPEGMEYYSTRGVKDLENKAVDTAKTVINSMQQELDNSKALKKYLLENSNKTLNVDDILQKATAGLTEDVPNSGAVLSKIKNIQNKYNGNLPLSEIDDLIKDLRIFASYRTNPIGSPIIDKSLTELTDKLEKQITSSEAQAILKDAPDELKKVFQSISKAKKPLEEAGKEYFQESLDNLPVKDINDRVKNTMYASELLGDINTARMAPEDRAALQEIVPNIKAVLSGKVSNPEEYRNNLKKVLSLLYGVKGTSDASTSTRYTMTEAMKHLQEANPELAAQLSNKINETSHMLKVGKELRDVKSDFLEASPTGKGLLGKVGQVSLGGVYTAGKGFEMAKMVSEVPENILKSVASRFGEDTQTYKMIQEAVSNPDQNKRRAIINTLMQLAPFRKMLKEEQDAEETR